MILVDTHVALWVDQQPARLGPAAHSAIASDEVSFSAVLAMESAIKSMLGRWPGPADLAARLRQAGLTDLPLETRHAEAMREFPELTGHDPFDRLYVAQAHVERATLLTADRRLVGLGYEWIVDARQ